MQHAAPTDNGSPKKIPSLNVVLDSNVLISGILYGGRAAGVVEHVVRHHEFITSRYIIDELINYIKRVRPKASHAWTTALQRTLLSHARDYDTSATHTVRDVNDTPILQLAIEHNALIVTGDKDLLEYKTEGQVVIITIAEYEEIFLTDRD